MAWSSRAFLVAAAAWAAAVIGPPRASAVEPAANPAADPRGLEIFTKHLRPLLAHRCGGCHGAGAVEGGFDISTREKLLAGGDRGPAVLPGKATDSLMYRLAARLEEPHMPEEGDALTEQELGWLAEWINRGAAYDKPLIDDADRGPWTTRTIKPEARDFWAFRPLASVEPPRPADPRGWCRNPIDRFILAKLEQRGLGHAPEAAAHTLRRRLALDLTGLPPSPVEVAAFVADPSEAAYESVVDDLLARPAFGERWAQHWLDVARFAESFGYEQDYDRPHAFHYRDFVIKAFNDDLPYDTFLQWQVAGDELAGDRAEARKATGFLAAGAFPTQLTEKEFESARYGELDDMIGTLGTAALGLTIGCARCHDHKFDPMPQADYYRLAAAFTTTIRGNVEVDVDPAWHRAAMEKWQPRLDAAVAARAARERQLDGRLEEFVAGWKPGTSEPAGWHVGTLVSATTQAGGSFVPLADGSLLAAGDAADRDTCTVVVDVPFDSVASLRLDAIADPSLPSGGPGRGSSGGFALSGIAVTASAIPEKGKPAPKPVALKFIRARADQSQPTDAAAVSKAIDGDAASAWVVDSRPGVSRAAAFDFEQPAAHPGGARLTVTLGFAAGNRQSIGRLRLSVATAVGGSVESIADGRDPVDPFRKQRERLGTLVAKPAADRTAGETAELQRLRRLFDAEWVALDTAVRRAEAAKPRPKLVRVLVAGENVPKIPHNADGRGFPHFYPQTHFLRRGDVNAKEGVAEPGLLQVLIRHPDGLRHWQKPAPQGSTSSHRRATVARWLTDVDHGAGQLAARVIVNRLWQHHFGEGLVSTPSDFGKQGQPPSHPELLEWLAGELVRGGWRLKPIHRLMVTSAAYRQSSQSDPAKMAVDPGNRLVWRYNRRRLEGEAIRDSMLVLAGTLDPQLYGRAGRDESSPRRSIYLEVKRSRLPLFLRTFDSPDFVSGLARRATTTTAPQALALMNSPAARGWAEKFASRIAAAHPTPADRIDAAYRTAVGRGPTPTELHDATLFLEAQQAGGGHANAALADLCQVIMGLNETLHIE